MALSSKISTIYIRSSDFASSAIGSWKYEFVAHGINNEIGQVNYNQAFDEAIDGSLRSNLRGFRLSTSLNWQKLHESIMFKYRYADINGTPILFSDSTVDMGDFFEDLITSLVTNSDRFVEISYDDTTYHEVIPENLSYKTVYSNQIGRGSADLVFIGQKIVTSIPESLEAPSV